MSEIEALCGIGGETHLSTSGWTPLHGEATWHVTSEEGSQNQGVCVRPDSCPFNSQCTGKVFFTHGVDNGFSKATIGGAVFKSSRELANAQARF